MNTAKVYTVFMREIRTVLRTPAYLGLGLAYAAVVVAVAWFTGGVDSGYLSTAASLATPMELVVPVVAFALGYRVVLDDRSTGELEVLRTYGLSRREYVAGAYLGRFVALTSVLVLPLLAVGVLTWISSEPALTMIAWHGGVDSPVLLARFAVLTAVFGASVLSVAVAASAVSESVRTAVAAVVLLWIALALGADVASISGLVGGFVDPSLVVWLTSLSPVTAFRGLVLETVVGVAVGDVRATSTAVSLASLGFWTLASLAVAVASVWRDV